jgi:hypothetical protein
MVELRLTPAQVHSLERVIVATHRTFGEHFVIVHALLKMGRDRPLQEAGADSYVRRATNALVYAVRRGDLAAAQAFIDTLQDKYLNPQQQATRQLVRKALAWRMRDARATAA